MHDSGYAKSVIRLDAFKSIPNYKKIHVRNLKNVFVKSCSGDQQAILGHVGLQLNFNGKNGQSASYFHDFLISDFVTFPLLLG
jgi:hypothetical protein